MEVEEVCQYGVVPAPVKHSVTELTKMDEDCSLSAEICLTISEMYFPPVKKDWNSILSISHRMATIVNGDNRNHRRQS